jgi:hypothetical protein
MHAHSYRIALATLALTLSCGAAQATLLDRGGGLIYDTVLDITWLQDANYAVANGDDADGLMTWSQSVAWADRLVYAGFDDWRLPTLTPLDGSSFKLGLDYAGESDHGYNIGVAGTLYAGSTASEMAYMFNLNLGNPNQYTTAGVSTGCLDLPTTCLQNAGPFINLQPQAYWSGVGFEEAGYLVAWRFSMSRGYQRGNDRDLGFYAWAVRPGDVIPVPEPQSWALLLAGLGLMTWRARRRRLN